MSAPISNSVASSENLTAFTSSSASFSIDDNGKIGTVQFLEASKVVVSIIDTFGKVFTPLKIDMNGNITKLTRKYNEDTDKHAYLEDMLLLEKKAGGIVAIDALQWLRRALHCIVRFFQCILEDEVDKSEDLTGFLKVAYSETLERYHGWMAVQSFNLIIKFAPKRRDLIYNLALKNNGCEEQVLRDMKLFTEQLVGCVLKLVTFYNENDLECHKKV